MKQKVEFQEIEDFFQIKLIDEDSKEYILDRSIEPEDKPIIIGLTREGEVRIKEVNFPKSTYSYQDVKATADRISDRFNQEGCKSCIALSEVGNTEKTFLVPTPRDLVVRFLDTL